MGTKRRRNRAIIVCAICLIVAVAIIATALKPSISQYEEDFGFSLNNVSVKTLDHFHHDDFRDSVTIYRASVSGDIDGSIFDPDKMSDGLLSEAEVMLKMAADQTKEKHNFSDLSSIDPDECKSTVLESANKETDERLCVIRYGSDEYLVIWVG